MDEDEVSFDFESKLAEQQRKEAQASASTSAPNIPSDAAVSVNQSAGSFKRNYRQTVCTYWLKGVCALGDKCGFLHEYNVERMPVCRNVLKAGVCREPDCPYKHTLDDIKECNMYKLGFCVYGPQCRYRHPKLPGPPPEPKDIDCTRLKDLKRQSREAMFAEYRGRGRGGRGRTGVPRPPAGQPPPPPQESKKRAFQEMSGPPMQFGFGHGMMGMPGMMMTPMQMGMGMGYPYWRGPGMFPHFRYQ